MLKNYCITSLKACRPVHNNSIAFIDRNGGCGDTQVCKKLILYVAYNIACMQFVFQI